MLVISYKIAYRTHTGFCAYEYRSCRNNCVASCVILFATMYIHNTLYRHMFRFQNLKTCHTYGKGVDLENAINL